MPEYVSGLFKALKNAGRIETAQKNAKPIKTYLWNKKVFKGRILSEFHCLNARGKTREGRIPTEKKRRLDWKTL